MASNTGKLCFFLLVVCVLAATTSCFEREGTAKDLAGTTWLVEDIDGKGVIDIARTTVEFPEPGRIAGETGCNRYSGTIWFNGDRYGVKGIAQTERACSAAVMEQERRFLKALQGGQRMVVEGTYLRFYDAAGNRLMRLTELQ